MRQIELKCESCEFITTNKKSFSNHIRYGCCKRHKPSNIHCKYCARLMPKKKPSAQGLFCDRECYYKWVEENKPFIGDQAKNFKTGESRTRLYSIWLGMKRRCVDAKFKDFKNYGGRGITMSEQWGNDFLIFKEWAQNNGYKDTLTIERVDVNGNYVPDNCTWIPMSEQSKNRRNARKKN